MSFGSRVREGNLGESAKAASRLVNQIAPRLGESRQRLAELWQRGWLTRALVVGATGISLGGYTVAVAEMPSSLGPLLAVAALAPFVGLVVGNLRRLMLAAIALNIPFGLGTNLGYRFDAANLGAFGGLNLTLTTLALVGLYGLWLGDWLAGIDGRTRLGVRPAIPLIAYVGLVGLSGVFAGDKTLAIYELVFLVQTLLMFIYVASAIRTRQDVLFLTTFLLVGLALESLVIGLTRFSGQDFSFGGISTRTDPGGLLGGGPARAGGTIGSPNGAAGYLSFFLPPAIGLLLVRPGALHRLLAVSCLLFGVLALLLTQSRGGWIAFAVATTLMILYALRRRWLSAWAPLVTVVAVGCALYLFRDALLARLLQDDQGAASSRLPLIHLAFDVIRDHPITGVGANNFALIIKDYATPEFSRDWLYTVHNKYLLVWAEDGLLALGCFLWFLFATVRRGIGVLRTSDRVLAPLALGYTTAVVGQMTHMFVDIFNGRPLVQQLWLVAALIAAMAAMTRELEPVAP